MGERMTGAVGRRGTLRAQAAWIDWDRLLAQLPGSGEDHTMPERAADLPLSLSAPLTAVGPANEDADAFLFEGSEPVPSAEAAGWRLRLRGAIRP